MNKKIFLSHSSFNKEIVNSFMENILIGALGIDVTCIFNTSGLGTGIEIGQDWRQGINDNLNKADFVILFISDEYRASEICLNELGATWGMGKKILPIVIPPVDFETVGVLINVRQIVKINSDEGLDRIRDYIVHALGIDANSLITERWTAKKKKFLSDVNYCINKSSTIKKNNYYRTNQIRQNNFKDRIINLFETIILNF